MKIGLKKGFTLIELLIVIAIIGILAVALLPTILGAPAKGRDAARKAHLGSMMTAIEAANLKLGGYPTVQACVDTTGAVWGTRLEFFQGGTPPVDPLGANGANFAKTNCGRGEYLYTPSTGAGGKMYALVSYMETLEGANALWDGTNPTVAAGVNYTIPPVWPGLVTKCDPMTTTGALIATSCVYIMQK